jgi:hypothetical protein
VVLPGLTAPPGGDHADIGAYEQQAETEETNEPDGGGPSRLAAERPRLGLGRHTFTVSATAAGQHGKAAKVSSRVVRRHPRH